MNQDDSTLHGLSEEQVAQSRTLHGSNRIYVRPRRALTHMLREILAEPIFLLLLLTCALYFAIGDQAEAWLMVGAVVFVIVIEIVQEFRSETALAALQQLSQPRAIVIRDGKRREVPVEEIVMDDLIAFSEGERIPADGIVVQQNDLSVDEAILTGESLPVNKTAAEGENRLFQGTIVSSGLGVARVQAVGARTEFGKLGKSIESIETEPTPLQQQIDRFVRQMLLAGLLAFLIVFAINFSYEESILTALLFSLSFALALVPAEIPVAFTTFMALGAYRMTRQQVLVKQPKTVESLGAATVICLDKTGTITENRMSVVETTDFFGRGRVLEYAMWASEPTPFDAMEKAIHEAYEESADRDRRPDFEMVYEYALSGVPPMMTHVYHPVPSSSPVSHAAETQGDPVNPPSPLPVSEGGRVIATKGAVERILRVCHISGEQQKEILEKTKEMARKGYRVLGVASAEWSKNDYPKEQDDFPWQFEGLIALYDPPKPNIKKVMNKFYEAGIAVKMVTGDYPETAMNIARESGIRVEGEAVTGEEVMQMSESQLRVTAGRATVFARMFPDAKLRVVNALKSNGEVVAMTGDGVNDGPALKAAPVGVAMGRRGTEIAKGAASMVLLDDDLAHMVRAVKTGRRIYQNLRKAIRYIISIHLPIVLVVLLPLLFGWPYLHMLMPVHVIFLELIMDPTCAIAFENEPAEPNVLQKPPRAHTDNLFSWRELSLSLVQGLVITAGVFVMYHFAVAQGKDENTTRSFVFVTMLAANIFLTLANRSFEYTIARTIFYRNNLLWWIIGASTAIAIAIMLAPSMREMFQLGPLNGSEVGWCLLTALVSVGWFEVWKGLQK
ncbi:MAG: cation-translocating P-type ATPase [Haliscomenobacteraceae bacterium CHB4]|nr:cation-translocating P-type ATPase [Haliscomenobacteraceae bacterium CHB4]